jgi:hypothetical protein
MHDLRAWVRTILVIVSVGAFISPAGAQVSVRYPEGSLHGFLLLRTLEGEILASGDLTQVIRKSNVTVKLAFHFKDGSVHEETATYTQRRNFRLLTDHLVQKGPSFPHPLDLVMNVPKNSVTVRYESDDHKEQVESQHTKLPPDLANGLIPTLLKNISPQAEETKLSMVVATPKPRLVKLSIRPEPEPEESFAINGSTRKAIHYVVKIELGGLTGLVAPIIGKEPPDSHVWILDGEAPAFLKSELPLYQDGPIWRIELTSPVWSKGEVEKK